MAIEIVRMPKGMHETQAGPLSLPPWFDRRKWAAKWVKEGPEVEAAREREWLVGTEGVTADGWQPALDSNKKPHKIVLSKGTYVLLCRPQEIQQAVNAIYGNVGKERLMQERRGETTGGVPTNDPGLLSDERLAKVLGPDQLEEGDVILNKVPDVRRVELQPIELAKS